MSPTLTTEEAPAGPGGPVATKVIFGSSLELVY